MTYQELKPFAIPRDRLGRWCLLGEAEGRAKPVVAGGIRTEDNARRLAACWNACRSMTTEQIEDVARGDGFAAPKGWAS